MSSVIQNIQRLVHLLYEKIWRWLQTAPPGSLQLTGVLGAAALLASYYHLKRQQQPRDPSSQQQQEQQQQQQQQQQQLQQQQHQQQSSGARLGASAAPAAAASCAPKASSSNAASSSSARQAAAAISPLGSVVRAQLQGAARVTISAAGVLTEEWDATQWTDGATLRPGAAELLQEISIASDLYLIAHVVDDVGQALVTGALEAADLLGGAPGQLKPHKLLFCSTQDGKVSIVRQLEPDLHIDGAPTTLEALRRFMPRLLHIAAPGSAPLSANNITSSTSLAAFFGQV